MEPTQYDSPLGSAALVCSMQMMWLMGRLRMQTAQKVGRENTIYMCGYYNHDIYTFPFHSFDARIISCEKITWLAEMKLK
jgi:hypothetical protein